MTTKKAVDSKRDQVITAYFSEIAKDGHKKMREENPSGYSERQAAAGRASKGKGLGKRGKYKRKKAKKKA